MIEQYYNISYKIDIVIHKKYLEDTESDALLHIVLSDPKHIKHALVTKAGQPIDIVLDKGDLCIINYPTNNYWLHSIPTDDTIKSRASLIFRNFD